MTAEDKRAAALALRLMEWQPTEKGDRARADCRRLAEGLEAEARAMDEEDEARAAWAALQEQCNGFGGAF